jgi:hypothetical protein
MADVFVVHAYQQAEEIYEVKRGEMMEDIMKAGMGVLVLFGLTTLAIVTAIYASEPVCECRYEIQECDNWDARTPIPYHGPNLQELEGMSFNCTVADGQVICNV